MHVREGRPVGIAKSGKASWLPAVFICLASFALILQVFGRSLEVSAMFARARSAADKNAGLGGRTPAFDRLLHSTSETGRGMRLGGLLFTTSALVFLVVSGVKKRWAVAHSVIVVLVAAGFLLGMMM